MLFATSRDMLKYIIMQMYFCVFVIIIKYFIFLCKHYIVHIVIAAFPSTNIQLILNEVNINNTYNNIGKK